MVYMLWDIKINNGTFHLQILCAAFGLNLSNDSGEEGQICGKVYTPRRTDGRRYKYRAQFHHIES